MSVKKTRLKLSSGLPLVIIEIPTSKTLAISLWIKAGARVEPDGKAGLAHLLEHLILKKTKNYPTDKKLGEVLELAGAWKNGTTYRDTVNYTIFSLSKHANLTLNILSEMVKNPLIDKDGFETEREVVKKEIVQREVTPSDLVWDVWFKSLCAKTPLASPILGTPTSLDAIRLDDIQTFIKSYYFPANSLLVVSGGISVERTKKLAEKYFGNWNIPQGKRVPRFKYFSGPKVEVSRKDLEQSTLLVGFRTTERDFYSSIVLRSLLSGGWSSRLVQRLRVKEGLIYDWEGETLRYMDFHALCFVLSTEKEKFKKLVSIFFEELRKLKENGVDKKELLRVKGYIEGTTFAGIETSLGYHNWYAKDELLWPGKSESVESFVSKIRKITADEVVEIANKYFNKDNLFIGVVGNVDKKDIEINL